MNWDGFCCKYTRDRLANVNVKPIVKPAVITKPKKPVPKCPTCGSENIKRLDIFDRGLSIGLFGLASKKINKSFECRNCKYTW